MEPQNQIFRKVALDRLSSPEQLDHLMKVTSPKGWMALVAIGSLVLVTILWGVFGNIPTVVTGQGILIRGGSIYDVVSVGAGSISKLHKRVNDNVEVGDVLATISQPELELKIRHAREELKALSVQDEELLGKEKEMLKLDLDSYDKELKLIDSAIIAFDEQIKGLKEKVSDQEKLLGQNLITKSALLNARNDLYLAQQGQSQSRIRRTQVSSLQVNRPVEIRQQQETRKQKIEEVSRNIALLQRQFELNSQIRSPYAGRILEIVAEEGNSIISGGRLLSLEKPDPELTVVTFVPAADGKRVTLDREVQISPSTVKREEYGFLEGKVTFVARYPSTSEGMMRVLRNSDLVKQLSGTGAPIEVRARLSKDPNGKPLWSSSKEHKEVDSGTLCANSIIVEWHRPIELVIPTVRKWFGK